KKFATDRLITLLPKLKASDRDLLNDAQRLCLYKSLIGHVTPKVNPGYLISAFDAIAQVGDERALPFVKPFYTDRMVTLAGQEVFEAADACRSAIKERIEIDRKNNMLLRPAATSSDPEVLLKPVGAPQEAEAMQLLRGSTQE